ncbi:glycolate oxidase subunit GlcF [Desulforhopalus singaporensis]|uniref:Glycolate oxidase iron-sulfur subunit n=1 Tax=Desulforhopalus singaporensis TaxID=91360 RepID=A0A1H0U356_9BACT|nr:glycolate oxidase subunit GlcF [Desulforhopalus singaporensis]SDP60581.1 glycolate oxidase iron-sulfur subunit [Desulforhopalus singaporensis]
MLTKLQAENFRPEENAETIESLRHCTTCGMCTSTCPTYLLSNDEHDSPRGRNKIMRQILESGQAPTEKQVYYLERCLSCFSCTTTCPSGVGYKNLMDWVRHRIDQQYQRPWQERLQREAVLKMIPSPSLFSAGLKAARLIKPVKGILPQTLRPMLDLVPDSPTKLTAGIRYQVFAAAGTRKYRVSMLAGCAQQVLSPSINDATIRLLNRHHCEVVIAHKSECCGALYDHLGKEEKARAQARLNVAAWYKEMEQGGLDAIIINASGCGTTVKDYGHILRNDQNWREKAAKVAAIAKDITEFLAEVDLKVQPVPPLRVAYHSACSMQHGQQVTREPKELLAKAGFTVLNVPEGYLCCGSAGTYNIFQAETANKLKKRKVRRIREIDPDVVAGGNIGCIVQLLEALEIPMVHTVELLDWATGGPRPEVLSTLGSINRE